MDKALLQEIDEASNEARAKDEQLLTIRRQIANIFRKHNPEKLSELDGLLEKYRGKESDLLRAIQKKYLEKPPSIEKPQSKGRSWPTMDFQWSYNLKIYSKNDGKSDKKKFQMLVWKTEESLKRVQIPLDSLALSIGGECFMREGKPRALTVRRVKREYLQPRELVESAVEKMRELVHGRYRYDAKPSDVHEEHIRRKLEKERNQHKKSHQTNQNQPGVRRRQAPVQKPAKGKKVKRAQKETTVAGKQQSKGAKEKTIGCK
jgi:hypothetical protein